MFQFPSLPPAPYVFRYGYRRITSGEFPHSEIPGSMTGQRLPRAYRSRPRPSSALSAKASTVSPCPLDQENTGYRCRYGVFKVPATDRRPTRAAGADGSGRSLKTQQRTSRNRLATARRLLAGNTVEVDVLLGELGVLTVRRP